MVFISNLPPIGVGSGPVLNVQPLAVLQAQAAQSANPTAQQLLPSAVVATTLVPSYAPETPKPPKPVLRSGATPTLPSSPLAAQVIAQEPGASDEQLAVFNPRPNAATQQPPVPEEPEFLAQLRLARGDAPPAENTTNPTVQQLAAKVTAAATNTPTTTNHAALSTAISTAPALRPTSSETRSGTTPVVQQSIAGRKSSLAQTYGAASYALTERRNSAPVADPQIEAVG